MKTPTLVAVVLGFISLTLVADRSAAQAPDSFAGIALEATITGADYPFPPDGSFLILPASAGNTYITVFTDAVTFGSYTWTKTAAASGTLDFFDQFSGNTVMTLNLSSTNSGTFYAYNPGYPGSFQAGTFRLYSGAAPASIQGWAFGMHILYGADPFANIGDFDFLLAQSTNTYQVIGSPDVVDSSGTYTSSKVGPSSSVFHYTDAASALQGSGAFYWDTSTNGAFVLYDPTGPFQLGTFVVLSNPAPPGAISPLLPANASTLTERRPQFSWSTSSPTSAWYHLYLQRNGNTYLEQWVQTSTWIPSSDLAGGNYVWWVQGWNAGGTGPWSTASSFSIPVTLPGTLTAISPSQVEFTNSIVRYTWTTHPNAAWYQLYVMQEFSMFHNRWYATTNSAIDPASGTFAVDIPGHTAATYAWWVRAWSPDGFGPWTSTTSFNTADYRPNLVTLVGHFPSETNTSVIRYMWVIDPLAAWYQFSLKKNGSLIVNTWFAANQSVLDSTNLFAVDLPGHTKGTYSWYLRAWNESGFGPWAGGWFDVSN